MTSSPADTAPETATKTAAATTTSAAAEPWGELESLTRRQAGERAYVERLLDLWRRELGAPAAALYLRRDAAETAPPERPTLVAGGTPAVSEPRPDGGEPSEYLRELTVGEGAFPSALDDASRHDLHTYPLPGALLAAAPGGGEAEAPPAPEPHTLLLATAVRSLGLRQQLKRQHFRVNYRVVELESVYEVGLAIASTLDLDQLSEEILLRAVSLLDARRGALYRRVGDTYRLDRTFGGGARDAFDADDPALEPLLAGEGPGPEGLVPGCSHLLAVAIGSSSRPPGVIVVADKESRRGVGPFGDSDRRTLNLFANQATIALENARLHRQALEKERLEREMELAADIQRQILPDPASIPALPGWDLLGWSRPARQVGGDYYDLLPRGDRLVLTVADVTGKGIGAALLVSTLHSALHLLFDRVDVGAEMALRLNRHILESSAGNKFITLIMADLDPETGTLRFVNAGHNPGFVVRAGGTVETLDASGLPLGLMPQASYTLESRAMAAGDLLCLYSDGITECASPDGEEYGEERLVAVLRELHTAPLADVVERLDRETRDFAAGQPQGDDQTVVLLRRGAEG